MRQFPGSQAAGRAAAVGTARRLLRRLVMALRTVRFGAARCAAAVRLATGLRLALGLARGAPFFSLSGPEPSFWARRARFQTLRAAAECLRGRPQGLEARSEEHTSELQSLAYLVCRPLLEKKKDIPLTA